MTMSAVAKGAMGAIGATGETGAPRAPGAHNTLPTPTAVSATDIGAYLVLNHGSVAHARPTESQRAGLYAAGLVMIANAITTASAAGISGYTANALKRNGAVSAAAAHANVAAPTLPVSRTTADHMTAAAAAAMSTKLAT